MNQLLVSLVVMGSISTAHAGMTSSIQQSTQKFLRKSGSGTHLKNGKTISKNELCYLAINVIDWMENTATNFEFTVNGKTTGTDLDYWTEQTTQKKVLQNGTNYIFRRASVDNCVTTKKLVFGSDQVSFSTKTECHAASKNRSEQMVCKL